MFRTKSCLYQVYPGHIDKDPPRSGGQRRHSCKNLEALQGQDEQQCEKGGQGRQTETDFKFYFVHCGLRLRSDSMLKCSTCEQTSGLVMDAVNPYVTLPAR